MLRSVPPSAPRDPSAGASSPATRGVAAGVRTLERALQAVIRAPKSPAAAARLHVPPAGGGRVRAVPRGGIRAPVPRGNASRVALIAFLNAKRELSWRKARGVLVLVWLSFVILCLHSPNLFA